MEDNFCVALMSECIEGLCEAADYMCAFCPMLYLPDAVIDAIKKNNCITREEAERIISEEAEKGGRYPDDF